MAYRRSNRRGSYRGRSATRGRRSYKRRSSGRSYGGGGKTLRIVVEQAAPVGSVVPAPNAAVQMASKRSMF